MDPKNWLLDKRVIRRNLKRGVIEIEDFDKELNDLPNMEEASEQLELEPKDEEETAAEDTAEPTEA